MSPKGRNMLYVNRHGEPGRMMLQHSANDQNPVAVFLRRFGRQATHRYFSDLCRQIIDVELTNRPVSVFGVPSAVRVSGGWRIPHNWVFAVVVWGVRMEELTEVLATTRQELEAEKQAIQALANELAETSDIILPALIEQTSKIRAARMAAVEEVRQVLQAMKDVRAVVSGAHSDFSHLERFIALCLELKALKADGILDAVVEALGHLKETL